MKNIVKIIICMVFAAMTFCACAKTQEDGNEEIATEVVVLDASEAVGIYAKDANIGIAMASMSDTLNDEYCSELIRYMTEEEEFLEANLQVVDAHNQQDEQIKQLESLIELDVDVIILNPVEISTVAKMTNLCHEAQIPVIYVNRQPAETEMERWKTEGIQAIYVGGEEDYIEEAKKTTETVIKYLNGELVE